MISFSIVLKDYLALRRKLGFDLKTSEKFLIKFVGFL